MKNNKGFSLVELIVVIAIMAILAAIAIPTFAHFIKKSNEASDAELLDNINYILNLSCLDNGVDIRDVTYAEWDKDNKCVINVKVLGVDNDDIEASFVQHFGDVKKQEFKYIENITFNPTLHKFVEGESVYAGLGFTEGQLNDIKGSAFDGVGMDALLDRLGETTDLLVGLAVKGNEDILNMLYGDENATALALLLGYDDPTDPEFIKDRNILIDKKAAMLKNKPGAPTDPDDLRELAYAEILANAAVLTAATQNRDDQGAFIDLLSTDYEAAKTTLQANLGSDDPAKISLGTSQAAVVYALYTSYETRKGGTLPENFSVEFVIGVMKSTDFQKYLTDPATGQKDLKAYNAATDMIKTSANNKAAVMDVLVNGFNNPSLNAALKDSLK